MLEHKMSKIKKLFYSALVAFIGIGVNFDTEARVTKEVAEATLPYLLEIAGLPQSQQTIAQINAIVRVLYTNAGQREIINWVRNGVFPSTLKWVFAPLFEPPILPNAQKRKIGKFFPCQPINSFSSYASNDSRIGWYVLNPSFNSPEICKNLIVRSDDNLPHKVRDAINIGDGIMQNTNSKLAAILFVLDICDTANQIFNILDIRHRETPITGYNAGIRANVIPAIYNEYDYRPVSATSAEGQGDCVQTLYRHLINIAIQNDNNKLRSFNISHLPEALREYYTIRHGAINQEIITVPVTETEAGLTQLMHHQSWHDVLVAAVPAGTDITNGAINNIVTVLGAIRPPMMSTSALNAIARVYNAPSLNPTIPTSTGIGVAGTDQQANATAIQNALNALDGRCAAGNERFIVNVTDNMDAPQVTAIRDQLPDGTNLVIQIADRLWNRTITIGAHTAGVENAHAEITSIAI